MEFKNQKFVAFELESWKQNMNTEEKISYYSDGQDGGATRRRLLISRIANRQIEAYAESMALFK